MNYDSRFENLYNNIVMNNKDSLEKARKLAQHEKIIRFLVTFFIAFFGTFAFLTVFILCIILFSVFSLFILPFIIFLDIKLINTIKSKLSTRFNNYNNFYKKCAIEPLIKSFNKNFSYNPNLRY